MNRYLPEGLLSHTQENRAALASASALRDACLRETILEARASRCDREHNLHVDLGVLEGVIPRGEGALGIGDGSVRDIALISRVGKPVCFVPTALRRDADGKYYALLSRRRAQEKCMREYLDTLVPGDVIPARISHMENFGAFCDVGAGVNALLPIDAVSVSRIPHPSARFVPGQEIRAVVRARDPQGRITLTHKELLGTWAENAARFSEGETVPGVVRSVENYGVFVELAPNLAGLAEYTERARPGQAAAVYIKSINPERMKVKLALVDLCDETPPPAPEVYFFSGAHMDRFVYSPPQSARKTETVF